MQPSRIISPKLAKRLAKPRSALGGGGSLNVQRPPSVGAIMGKTSWNDVDNKGGGDNFQQSQNYMPRLPEEVSGETRWLLWAGDKLCVAKRTTGVASTTFGTEVTHGQTIADVRPKNTNGNEFIMVDEAGAVNTFDISDVTISARTEIVDDFRDDGANTLVSNNHSTRIKYSADDAYFAIGAWDNSATLDAHILLYTADGTYRDEYQGTTTVATTGGWYGALLSSAGDNHFGYSLYSAGAGDYVGLSARYETSGHTFDANNTAGSNSLTASGDTNEFIMRDYGAAHALTYPTSSSGDAGEGYMFMFYADGTLAVEPTDTTNGLFPDSGTLPVTCPNTNYSFEMDSDSRLKTFNPYPLQSGLSRPDATFNTLYAASFSWDGQVLGVKGSNEVAFVDATI